jgi:hypothetical protein
MAKSTDPDPSKPLFVDRVSFEAWLKGKPDEWAGDLAMRSALRVGVLLWPVHEFDVSNGPVCEFAFAIPSCPLHSACNLCRP